MPKFIFKIRQAGNPESMPVREEITANSAQEVVSLYSKMGFEVLDIKDEQSVNVGAALDENVQMSHAPGIPSETTQPRPFIPFVKSTPAPEIKYYTDGGVEFKLENGKLFKKDWLEIAGAESANYAVMVGKNSKRTLLSDAKLRLFKLDWIAIGEK